MKHLPSPITHGYVVIIVILSSNPQNHPHQSIITPFYRRENRASETKSLGQDHALTIGGTERTLDL